MSNFTSLHISNIRIFLLRRESRKELMKRDREKQKLPAQLSSLYSCFIGDACTSKQDAGDTSIPPLPVNSTRPAFM